MTERSLEFAEGRKRIEKGSFGGEGYEPGERKRTGVEVEGH